MIAHGSSKPTFGLFCQYVAGEDNMIQFDAVQCFILLMVFFAYLFYSLLSPIIRPSLDCIYSSLRLPCLVSVDIFHTECKKEHPLRKSNSGLMFGLSCFYLFRFLFMTVSMKECYSFYLSSNQERPPKHICGLLLQATG